MTRRDADTPRPAPEDSPNIPSDDFQQRTARVRLRGETNCSEGSRPAAVGLVQGAKDNQTIPTNSVKASSEWRMSRGDVGSGVRRQCLVSAAMARHLTADRRRPLKAETTLLTGAKVSSRTDAFTVAWARRVRAWDWHPWMDSAVVAAAARRPKARRRSRPLRVPSQYRGIARSAWRLHAPYILQPYPAGLSRPQTCSQRSLEASTGGRVP
jgi:hypothetical protein